MVEEHLLWFFVFLYSFDKWGTNALVCLRSFNSSGMKKLVFLRSFDSWGTNIFVFLLRSKKNYLRFFLLRSSCLLSRTVGPLRSCHTTGAWAAPGLAGKTGSGAAPGGAYTTEAWAVHVRVYTWEACTAPGGVLTPQHSSWRIRSRSRNVLKCRIQIRKKSFRIRSTACHAGFRQILFALLLSSSYFSLRSSLILE